MQLDNRPRSRKPLYLLAGLFFLLLVLQGVYREIGVYNRQMDEVEAVLISQSQEQLRVELTDRFEEFDTAIRRADDGVESYFNNSVNRIKDHYVFFKR